MSPLEEAIAAAERELGTVEMVLTDPLDAPPHSPSYRRSGEMSLAHHPALSAHPEQQYLDLLRHLLDAPERPDRTGTGVRGMFRSSMTFDLADGFPLLTTKKVWFKGVAAELLWFLTGSTNVRPLQAQGVRIWDLWADANGDLGPVYGAQWRHRFQREVEPAMFPTDCEVGYAAGIVSRPVDQIAEVLDSLRSNPYGRRHIVTAWNPADVPDMALPPCHCLFQFYVENDGRLSLSMYQRSADVFLGLPFNIASYALLLTMFARVLGRDPGRFIWDGGDVHLYSNHVDQAREQVQRSPRPFPTMTVAKRDDLDSWCLGDFTLQGYDPHPHIAGEASV